MTDVAASMAMLILGAIIIIVLLRILVLVHQQNQQINDLKKRMKLTEIAREEKEKNNG